MRHRGELKTKPGSCWNRNTGTSVYRAGLFRLPKPRSITFYASRLMKFKADGGRTFVLILDQAEEAFAAVTDFANDNAITAASGAAIVAFESTKVGWVHLAAEQVI